MKTEQVKKIIQSGIVITLILLIMEIVFSIPQVNDFFKNLIENTSGWVVYLVIWVIMFAQVTILNIPAYVVLTASVNVGLEVLSWQYLLTVISAYMVGCILAYWLGRKFGMKAVKWCAGSDADFDKWSKVLNDKGKWWYFATIVFPMFPDDLLCLVAGAVKFNFKWYTIFNLIGRSIGLVAMCLTLKLIGSIGGGIPYMIIVWGVAMLIEIIAFFIVNSKIHKKNQK